jgi:hypothetical protein
MSSESMLLSKMTGNGKLVQCFVYESIDKELLHRWQPFEYIYFPWITMNNTTLNPEYFRFAEQPVKLLNTPDTLGLAPNSKPALEINFAKSAFKRTLPFQLETVEIVNSGDRTINSGGDQNIIQITGFWKNDKGTVIDNPSVRFLADVDKGKIRQLMIFQLPPPGKYSFTFQLSVNNQVFCELNTIHNLKIED